uniref:galactinol--sucrose galactosyltransferase n=1 Tax=Ananas comosus var. bracteatus TaxID=296719 RepID=A0A6V7QIF0_ANACO|nr:unnamed protein product [Ananas comosus var. bracteatus]
MAPNLTKSSDVADVLAGGFVDGDLPPSDFAVKGGDLTVRGHPFLLDVPPNITLAAAADFGGAGAFVGFDTDEPLSRHVAPVGRLAGIRFMSIFRFKVWWTTHWVGSTGADVEHETQLLVLDRSNTGRPYVLLLPLIEGSFRASLQRGERPDFVDMCRSVPPRGDDPYALVKDAMQVVRAHLGTFKLLDEKSPPGIVDKFGWCTWDAFYLKVHPEGVWEGVKGLAEGGCPPGLLLIDDGWQTICHDDDDPASGEEGMNRTSAGEQMPCRLIKFEENRKFRDYTSKKSEGNCESRGLGAFVGDVKGAFPSVEHVYVWHALCGYWGGVRPHVRGMPPASVVAPRLSEGLKTTMEDLAVDKIVNNGVGLVEPGRAHELYQGLHSHLQRSGIDGVKVDVIHILEMLCEEYGGRVELAKAYYRALTDSVKKHFKGNGVIASMEHCNDFMFLGTETISLGRVGDDFWCTDPSGDPNGTYWLQGCHMVHCAYNSLWMGQFIHPDWDMFQSTHPCAAFHAASRAISGGPVYVSDAVGRHDFDLLRRLALPDGTILRCAHYALPTRDCLFEDPLHNGKTMLKIWNLNRVIIYYAGIIIDVYWSLGAFNCQGGGWCPKSRRNKCASEFSRPVTATARPSDVEWKNGKHPISVKGVEHFAVYFVESKKLKLLEPQDEVEITLDPFNYELLVVSPVKKLSLGQKSVQFAPIGLANMLNAGGAIESAEFKEEQKEITAKSMVGVQVPWTGSSTKLTLIEYLY